jgi:hypothetical protein
MNQTAHISFLIRKFTGVVPFQLFFFPFLFTPSLLPTYCQREQCSSGTSLSTGIQQQLR